MISKQLNPNYYWLLEHLHSEKVIAESRGDLDTYAKIMASSVIEEGEDWKSDCRFLREGVVKHKFSPRYSVAVSVCLLLDSKGKMKLDKNFKSKSRNLLSEIIGQHLPRQKVMDVCYYLRQLKGDFKEIYKEVNKYREIALEKKDIELLIESSFALGQEADFESVTSMIATGSLDLPLGRRSKVAILGYNKLSKEVIQKILEDIETDCYEKLDNMSLPSISLAIYEAEKIINTNLKREELNNILNTFRSENKKWSKLISEIEEDGVTVNLEKINGFLNISSEDSLWALELMNLASRRETYQVGEGEFEEYSEYRRLIKNGKFVTSKKALLGLVVFDLVAIGILTFLLKKIFFVDDFDWYQFLIQKNGAITSFFLLGLILAVYLSNLKFLQTGRFSILTAFEKFLEKFSN